MQHCCVCILGKTLHPEGILRKEYLRRTQGKVAANFFTAKPFFLSNIGYTFGHY